MVFSGESCVSQSMTTEMSGLDILHGAPARASSLDCELIFPTFWPLIGGESLSGWFANLAVSSDN